jgi:hypothetical protein
MCRLHLHNKKFKSLALVKSFLNTTMLPLPQHLRLHPLDWLLQHLLGVLLLLLGVLLLLLGVPQ